MTACFLCFATDDRLSFHLLTAAAVTAFLLSWPSSFLPDKWRYAIQLFIGETFLLFTLFDAYCISFLYSHLNSQILNNVFLSDGRETSEFISMFIGFHVVKQWRIAATLLLILLLPLALWLNNRIPANRNWKLGCVWKASIAFCFLFEAYPAYKYIQLFLEAGNPDSTEGLIFRHYHEVVPTPLHRELFAWYAVSQSEQVLQEIKKSTIFAEPDSCTFKSPHIVLLIGESYNKHHSSLYGYHLPTTPLQEKRKNNGELFPFYDIVTPWNITSNVFLDMFSLWNHSSKGSITSYPLFPILFRKSGYTVTFFSNQYVSNLFTGGVTNQMGNFFLADKELSNALFSFRNRHGSFHDMGLLGQIEDYKKTHLDIPHTLDIIHLLGQHFDYGTKYPDSLAVFTEKDYADRQLTDEARQVVCHYDNATRYNDLIVDKLLSYYEQEDAIVLYVSDHGEEVYDDLQVQGRLFQTPEWLQAKHEFQVPMWIWCSQTYRENHPEILSNIITSQHRPFLTDDIPQILLSLAGISSEWTEEHRNLLSSKYKSKPRIIGGTTDYDKLKP